MIWYAYWHCLVRGRVKVSKFDSICEDEDKSTQDSFLVDAVIAICVTAVFYDPTTPHNKSSRQYLSWGGNEYPSLFMAASSSLQ